MKHTPRAFRAALLILWAVLLSAFTAILGAAPLRVLRTLVGNGVFWLTGLTIIAGSFAMGLYPLAAALGAQFILIGAYAEFEERDFSMRQAASFAVLITALFLSSSFYTWTAFSGKGWLSLLINGVQQYLDRAAAMNISFLQNIKAQDIVVQIPSGVVIFLILSLGLSLIFEKSVSRWAGIVYRRRDRLTDFAAPDLVVWMLIVSMLGAFANVGMRSIEMVSFNMLNVCVVIYFFQGLAVLGKYFETFKVGFFWRFIWIFLVVVQLPVLMSLLGLVDYWADFRRLLQKKAADMKKKSLQE